MEEKNKKTIIGRINGISISETISNYQPNQPEQVLTAKKNIRRKFDEMGEDPNSVIFE